MRITAIQVEIDGNDAGAIVRGLTEAMQGGPARPAQTGQEACPTVLIEAPAPAVVRRKYGPRKGHHKDTKAQSPAAPLFASITDAVRQAVLDGPKSNVEICDWIEARGAVATSSQVSQVVFALRTKNEIYKGDQDLKWRPAQKPQAR